MEIFDTCIKMQTCHSGLLGVWRVLREDEWRQEKQWDGKNRKRLQAAIGSSFQAFGSILIHLLCSSYLSVLYFKAFAGFELRDCCVQTGFKSHGQARLWM